MTSSFSVGFSSDHPCIESTSYTLNTWLVGSWKRWYLPKMMTSFMNNPLFIILPRTANIFFWSQLTPRDRTWHNLYLRYQNVVFLQQMKNLICFSSWRPWIRLTRTLVERFIKSECKKSLSTCPNNHLKMIDVKRPHPKATLLQTHWRYEWTCITL